ncbi:MAG: Fe-S cluster assembly protein SufD [Defluviicoccus sp.]
MEARRDGMLGLNLLAPGADAGASAGGGWLGRLKADAARDFAARGLPTRKVEAWKYTDLRPLAEIAFRPVDAEHERDIRTLPAWVNLGSPQGSRLVFVNGRYRPDLSFCDLSEAGVSVTPLTAGAGDDGALAERLLGRIATTADQPLVALNTARIDDGVCIHVCAGVHLRRPIEIVSLGSAAAEPLAWHGRTLIVLDDGASATVIERHLEPDDALTPTLANDVTEIALGAAAQLCHYRLQAGGAAAFHVSSVAAALNSDAVYEAFTLTTGGRLVRNETSVSLDAPGAEARLAGAYLVDGTQHLDTTTVVEHRAPRTTCREVFKGVVDGTAEAVFQGRIVVHREAQGTSADQLTKALLLSDGARVNQKPELEIYADDVKCSHGAAAGQIDREALFYLRSRGLPASVAQRLLIEGFLGEALAQISKPDVREAFSRTALTWLKDR